MSSSGWVPAKACWFGREDAVEVQSVSEYSGIENKVVMSLLSVQADFMSGASSREIGSQ